MPLPSGTKLGPYEVVAPLGAGGMGEVYRARDERLARDVAVKVLPPGLAQDAERMRRFEHEARAAGSLNHPHILAVYDTGRHDGSPYVVSELLVGQTLRERIAGGALPMRKAVEIAAQIARGLAAAHEKGIVHRDLKPENVFITDDGLAKILDFGLAKLTQAAPEDESDSPTRTRETDPGVVLGTVGYMAPEQVRGAAVDHRADIFSFGAMLYEMLSGQRAFKKETSAETMAAILREDPPDLTATNKALPPALERIVAHCLEKNPQERFASARDLAFDLESLSEKSGATTARALHAGPGTGRRAWLAAAWLAALLAAAGAAFWAGRRGAERPQPRYQQLTYGHGYAGPAFFSPDGASILYSARWDGAPPRIFSLRLDLQLEQPMNLEGRLVGVAGGELAFLTPDGTLFRAPLSGSGAREVATGVDDAEWSRDGTRFAITRRSGSKFVLEYPIGTVVHETVGGIGGIGISPDGSRVAIYETRSQGDAEGWIEVVDKTGLKRLTNDPKMFSNSLIWSPDGREVWFSTVVAEGGLGFALNAVSLDGRRRLLMRTAHRPVLWAASPDGRVLLSLGAWRRQVAGLPPGGTLERDLTVRGLSDLFDLALDGRHYVVSDFELVNTGKSSAFLGSLEGGPLVRLGDGLPSGLSPDGRSVVAYKDSPDGILTALQILPTGAGEPRDVPRGTLHTYFDVHYLPDGRRLLIAASEADRPRRLFVQELPDGLPKPVTPEGIFTEYTFTTPDGEWVPAGGDYRTVPYHLYPLKGGDPRPIPGLEKGDQPLRFTADGRRLFVRYGVENATRARLALLDLSTGRKEPWKVLSPADPAGVMGVGAVCITPDGRSYLYSYERILNDLFLVDGLR
jgi:hypothetical protein